MLAKVGFVSSECLRKSLTTYSLYVLRDPDTDEVRYVGCCEKPGKRLNGHMNTRVYRGQQIGAWIDGLKSQGKRPRMVIVETCLGRTKALWRERQLISRCFRIVGHRLLNFQRVPNFFPLAELERRARWYRHRLNRLAEIRAWRNEKATA